MATATKKKIRQRQILGSPINQPRVLTLFWTSLFTAGGLIGGENDARAATKANSGCGIRFTPSLDGNFVAVLQEAPLRTIRQVYWLCSAPSIFEQATSAVFRFTADCTAANKIATVHWTASACVVSEHLCE